MNKFLEVVLYGVGFGFGASIALFIMTSFDIWFKNLMWAITWGKKYANSK